MDFEMFVDELIKIVDGRIGSQGIGDKPLTWSEFSSILLLAKLNADEPFDDYPDDEEGYPGDEDYDDNQWK